MTAGLRVCTVTGATVSVIAAGNDGGCGWASETLIVCERLVGMIGALPSAGRSTATSSHTSALSPGPTFVVGCWELPRMRVQYASWSPARVSNILSPANTANDVIVTSCDRALVSCSS